MTDIHVKAITSHKITSNSVIVIRLDCRATRELIEQIAKDVEAQFPLNGCLVLANDVHFDIVEPSE